MCWRAKNVSSVGCDGDHMVSAVAPQSHQRGVIDPCSRSWSQNVCVVFTALFAFPVFQRSEWSVKLIGRWQGKCNYVLMQQEAYCVMKGKGLEKQRLLWRKAPHAERREKCCCVTIPPLFDWPVWAFLNPGETVSHSAWPLLSLCLCLQSYSLFG